MSYHYERKLVIKSKLQFWIWSFVGVTHGILLLLTALGFHTPTPMMFYAAIIQFICGTGIALFNIDLKRVRVENELDIHKSADYAADAGTVTASDLKQDLLK